MQTTAAATGRRRGPRKGDLKEAAILDTASELLGRKPLSEITTEALAKGAGISRVGVITPGMQAEKMPAD